MCVKAETAAQRCLDYEATGHVVSLFSAKKHLRIEPDEHEDDGYVSDLITAAEGATLKALKYKSWGDIMQEYGELPEAVRHAILLLVGNWYANREPVAYCAANDVPHTYTALINLYIYK